MSKNHVKNLISFFESQNIESPIKSYSGIQNHLLDMVSKNRNDQCELYEIISHISELDANSQTKLYDWCLCQLKNSSCVYGWILGSMHLNCYGKPYDEDKIYEYFTMSAVNNNVNAMYMLGILHTYSASDYHDPKTGKLWFLSASNLGCVSSTEVLKTL
jgi:TPR repeat protein